MAASTQFDPKQARRAGFASFVGTAIEWYDFYTYATAAALIFGSAFFPGTDRLTGIAASFATYAVGFFLRPLGGIIWGHIGDRFGRRPALVGTLLMMGVSTVLVGLLPTYATLGVAAPVLLVVLRSIQGLAVGGEWGGAVLMATEHVPDDKKTFYGGFPQLGNPAGALAATGLFSLMSLLGDQALHSWGWRVPFLASVILIVVGLYVRTKVEESPVFTQEVSITQQSLPIKYALEKNWRSILLGIGAIPIATGGYYLVTTYAQSYGTGPEVGMTSTVILNAMTVASFFELVGTMFVAKLGDIIGRKLLISLGLIVSAILIAPMFLSFTSGSKLLIFALVAAVRVAMSATYAPMASFMSQLFRPQARYTSVSISNGVGVAIYGGLAPVTATFVYKWTGTIWGVIVMFFIFVAINLICALLAPQHTDASERGEQDEPEVVA